MTYFAVFGEVFITSCSFYYFFCLTSAPYIFYEVPESAGEAMVLILFYIKMTILEEIPNNA